ncbi:acetyltransferase [Sporosarcina sp. NCCP-2222]|uniref:GNAT family N-acetyltransferase n=1 Tax=Sporosarcina sp. NCCP-2222 TaxID=2935073 RepID=UPI002086902A|nr:GNAT family protein [Sporosarcina sp. NCCP-2222]GKV56404.1 acetyltransferase [Sporosarcina sp. NCCP-2222]
MFQSKRVKLRKMESGDIPTYHAWRNDMEVMTSTNPILDLPSFQETEAFVNEVILGSPDAKSYMIVDQLSGQAIGITSLIHIDMKNRNAECIIDIGEKDFHGKGYGREALTLLLDYAFREINLHRVALRVFSFNERAISLYEKIGFQHEGASREALFRNGQWHDVICMGILQSEYMKLDDTEVL